MSDQREHPNEHDRASGEPTRADTLTVPPTTVPPTTVPPTTVVNSGTVDARITDITDEAAAILHRHAQDASGGGNRFLWFIGGFAAALLAGTVAAVSFLAISDRDDDGNLDLDVPAVELDVDP